MRKDRLFLGLAFMGVAALGYAAGAAKARTGVMWPASEIEWEEYAPGVPLQVAKLWGDRAKGEYGMLLKLPAGFHAGMHSHTGDYQAVAVQGTWAHAFTDGVEKELPPGSYVMQPGKQDHDDWCKSTTDCIVLVTQKVKGDFKPAKAAAAPMPAPK
jgi:hypothetical protein